MAGRRGGIEVIAVMTSRAILERVVFGLAFALLTACGNLSLEPQPLDRQAAGELAAVAAAGDEMLTALIARPTTFTPHSLARFSGNGLLTDPLRNLTVRLLPRAANCFQRFGGAVDADGDGIPASASYLIDCTVSDEQAGVSLAISGTSGISDDDDGDPLSGYDVTVTDFRLAVRDSRGPLQLLAFELDYDLDRRLSGYVLDYSLRLNTAGPGNEAGLTLLGRPTYTPDDWRDPFAAGTFAFDDSVTLSRNGLAYRVNRTSTALHYAGTCSGAFDDGGIRYRDGRENAVVVSYQGCDEVTVTYNGAALAVNRGSLWTPDVSAAARHY